LHLNTRAFALVALLAALALPARGADVAEPPPLPNADLELGRAAIAAKDWRGAVNNLQAAVNYEPGNADAWNLLGYASRNAGDYKNAFTAYERALTIDPNHRGAHEYIGEAYVLAGNKAKAQLHLAALERICGKECEEYRDLTRALARP
jgi:Flp pilus assembly protein TadD